MVGVRGLEPRTSWPPSRHSTILSYTPATATLYCRPKRMSNDLTPDEVRLSRDAPAVTAALAAWYRANRRDLPWRTDSPDPYAVLVSEVMLQQTQVATVIPYYQRWMARFPNVRALASAPLEDVLACWAGLGYYRRARALHEAAKAIAEHHGGRVPSTVEKLRPLPGVGPYTAAAVASIAYGAREALVDANSARVLARLARVAGDPRRSPAAPRLWRIARDLLPSGDVGEHNQALMELGALVCRTPTPECDACPIASWCGGRASGTPALWPGPRERRIAERIIHCSAVVRQDGRLLVRRRPDAGLWGGLWELPLAVCGEGEELGACAARALREATGWSGEPGETVATVRHAVMHYAVTLHAIEVSAHRVPSSLNGRDGILWIGCEEAGALAFASPQKRLLRTLWSHGAATTPVATAGRKTPVP